MKLKIKLIFLFNSIVNNFLIKIIIIRNERFITFYFDNN